jgi:hypothetical protein
MILTKDPLKPATHLVSAVEGATALCLDHAKMFTQIMGLLNIDNEVYEMMSEDDPIVCQACHLAYVTNGKQNTLQ